jgi:adhesin isopeptide-forming family sspB-C2 type protein/LPXTG-motif cell wall-anchored protein
MGFHWFDRSRDAHPGDGRHIKKGKALLAGVVAAATLLTPVVSAYAGDGGGTGSGGGGASWGDGHASIHWLTKDSWPATDAGVRQAISEIGYPAGSGDSTGDVANAINTSLSQALSQCQASYTGSGNADCRLVGVGLVGNDDLHKFTGISSWEDAGLWGQVWNQEVAGKTYSRNGINWNSTTSWNDKRGQHTLNSMADEVIQANLSASLRLIVLAKDQPIPENYDLHVSTKQQANAGITVGSTDAVSDSIVTSRGDSSIVENVNADVWLNYDGHPAGMVDKKSVKKSVSLPNNGTTASPSFSPADFGWDYWPEGSYWFDIDVAKQGKMNAAVNTTDREASETYRIPSVPPQAPTKSIEKGTSASRMVNRTTITSNTGKGGYAMTFTDTITPNGIDYTISNYKLIDKTDSNKDVSGDFTINWDKDANKVTAVHAKDKAKGFLPLNHDYEFSFDVTVSRPDVNKVSDKADVLWNDTDQSTDSHEFPTWKPNPDKTWIRMDAGKWQAVIDPSESNATGADNQVFLNGDKVGSAVNATVDANLIQAPTKFEIQDNWTASDYLVDPDGADSIRVYEADGQSDADGRYLQSSVSDIANTGRDVTSQFEITLKGSKATATAKPEYLKKLRMMGKPLQVTLLVPMTVNYANGKGAAQVRKDHGVNPGDELEFCDANGVKFTNSASETVNDHEVPTNEPAICGYVPPVRKNVLSEASEGGSQESVDGKVVYPGQKVEYTLTTTPSLPADLAYEVSKLVFTDTYDQYLNPDKQTVEMIDLNTGTMIGKSKYSTKWDDAKHLFQLTVTDKTTIALWKAGSNPRVQIRFEGTVDKTAPVDRKVENEWMLTLNNSLTPSNIVFNVPPSFNPSKEDNQGAGQGDPTVSIDRKTLLLGDTGTYVVNLDAKQKDQAYNVYKLGVVDDFDDQYVSIDPSKVEVVGVDGKDYTKRFNIQLKDGILYAFAKTVDTEIPATGETVKGDPQPTDLAKYAASKDHDALKDPAIDQGLLGRSYRVMLPYTVVKVTDGYVVKNKATQIVNDVEKTTNEVSNPLKPINPAKDVTIKVGGASVNGHNVWLNSTFLYQLDSSVIPADRAYPQVDNWTITDPLDPGYDRYTGQWAVYAQRDLYKDGQVIAAKGEKIAGTGFDSGTFGGDLFTASQGADSVVTVEATGLYRSLVSADTGHENGWRAYIQCQRLKVSDKVPNTFTEHYNGKDLPSNEVWTRTPDMTPSIHIEKWDRASGWPKGDRDDSKDALSVSGDTQIVFTITNTSKVDPETGVGAVFQAKSLKLTDRTIAGDGTVTDLTYPANWDTLVLKPGDKVEVTGTLKGVTKIHTDRAKVTGTPLLPCATTDDNPFGSDTTDTGKQDGVKLCGDTEVESNQDDWNGQVKALASTGTNVIWIVLAAIALGTIAGLILYGRKKETHTTQEMEESI